MRRGFSILEVLIATVILGFGIVSLVVAMSQAQGKMFLTAYLETAQEAMDIGDMAYPLEDVTDPMMQLDVPETRITELWDKISKTRLTRGQEEKFSGYTWEREWINKNDDDGIERLGVLHIVKVTVRWGDDLRGHHNEDSYVTFWRKQE